MKVKLINHMAQKTISIRCFRIAPGTRSVCVGEDYNDYFGILIINFLCITEWFI